MRERRTRLSQDDRGKAGRGASYEQAYRISHSAGWDAGNKVMATKGLSRWDSVCREKAAEVMRDTLSALGYDRGEA